MEELIARVTQATGLDAETAERAIGIIVAFLKKEGPPDEVGRLLAAMPGSEDVVAQSGDGGPGGIVGGFMGMMGGGVMALGADAAPRPRALRLRAREGRRGRHGSDRRLHPGAYAVRLTKRCFPA